MSKQAVLFFFPEWGGMHLGAWRAADSPAEPAMDFAGIVDMVKTAERGKFHGFFLADTLSMRHSLSPRALSRTAKASRFEPITLMAAMSVHTKHIGLLCTASTTYNEPYHVARMFASLDHLSGGRAGWNVVTSGTPAESKNFGRDEHMAHDDRYVRGEEFFDIVTGLWDSFDDDAWIRDREGGQYFDPEKMHAIGYRGQYLSVDGPLTVARPPQGWPLIAQAGSSPVGQRFSARVADVIYTLQTDTTAGRAYYDTVKGLVDDCGRDPEQVKIMPALITLIAKTQSEADERMAELDSLVDPHVGLEQLGSVIEYDLSGFDVDGPVPEIPETEIGSKTRQQYFLSLARKDNLSIRQLMQVVARLGARPHTPESFADYVADWMESGAADGFNITFADTTRSLGIFVNEVVPLLQARGLFHDDYTGGTLRENMAIPRPRSRYQ